MVHNAFLMDEHYELQFIPLLLELLDLYIIKTLPALTMYICRDLLHSDYYTYITYNYTNLP